MTDALIQRAADALVSLNARLLPLPPSSTEQTGHDLCYTNPDLLCRDLPDEVGLRGVISSWYLSPERHVVEMTIVAVICLAVLSTLRMPKLSAPNKNTDDLQYPPLLRLLIGACFALQIVYKLAGYPGKLYMMLMPCNTIWIMHFVHAFLPGLTANSRHVLSQLSITYFGLPVVAIATPDLSDLTLPFEVEYFFINHALLLVFPIYWVSSGRVSLLPPAGTAKGESTVSGNFAKWYAFACACFALFYFAFVTPVAIYSGINLNYMLSPPPNPGDVVSGPNFRLMSIGCCATLFFLFRFAALCAEAIATAIMARVRGTAKSKSL